MKRFHYVVLLIVSGVILAFTVSYLLQQQHINNTIVEFQSAAKDRIQALEHIIENSTMAGRAVVSLFASSEQVTRQEFSTFVKFILKNTSYIRALEWVPRIPANQRKQYEAIAAQDFPGFKFTQQLNGQIIAADLQQEYYPVFYIEPYINNRQALGFDLAGNAKRKTALAYARDNNRPSSTGRINLIQGNTETWGFLTYLPVYTKNTNIQTIEQRRTNIEGLVVIVFDIPALVESSLAYLQPAGIHLTLYDETATQSERFLYQHRSRTQSPLDSDWKNDHVFSASKLEFSDTLSVNHRHWSAKATPAVGYFNTAPTLEIWLVFIGINAITFLLAAYLHLLRQLEFDLRNEKDQLEITVSERTRDLEEKNKQLETFSYSIAHDLRSPLRAITGFSQILVDDTKHKLDQEEQDYLARIIAAGKHMANLIDDILTLSRVTQGKLNRKEIDFSDLAHGIAERIQNSSQEKSHRVSWVIHEDMKADGDLHLLTLLLDNLLLNAYKFSRQNPEPKIEVGLTRHVGEKIYYVRDNGIGFDMKFVDKIFGVFQRLHTKDSYEGTGIGLATVKRIIERHHGRIWAKSKTNEGATFYFTLRPQPNTDDQYI
ncbi:MAG: hypothetical protein GXP08_06340 [Gammaproteobacteria bacterium]|nr:hypothetical protein [Gammaproteobacteria bacterium]